MKTQKLFTKENLSFALAAFIIWTISEIVIDLITGVTFAEMLSVKYIVGYLVGSILFAALLLAFQLWQDKKKK